MKKVIRTCRKLADQGPIALCLAVAAIAGLTIANGSPALAAPTGNTSPDREAVRPDEPRGREILRVQMNALQPGLENLRRLRGYFDENSTDEGAVLTRVRRLVETLPTQDGASEAALRIAAVASLTLRSGTLAEVDIDNGYRLTRGTLGWDLGPDGSDVHTGFTPVTPAMIEGGEGLTSVPGAIPLTDGIGALRSFQATLPNGLYRVVILRDRGDTALVSTESPFGGDIAVNGAPVRSRTGAPLERISLTGNGAPDEGDKSNAMQPDGLGVEGWAIVEDGRIRVEFSDLPAGYAITAIIAEPFDIDRIELAPAVAETIAEAMGDLAPAAGPEPRNTSRGASAGVRASRSAGTQSAAASEGSRAGGAPPSGGRNAGPSATGFAATRSAGRSAGRSAAPAPTAAIAVEPAASLGPTFETSDAPVFGDREVLVKRSLSSGPDSDGVAIDLGSILDETSPTGIFACATEPCPAIPPIAPEPDIEAIAALLGTWLIDPTALPDGWEDLQTVLDGRDPGDDIAVVYEFDVDSESWTDVELLLNAGPGLFVWLDGAYVFGAAETGPFVDSLEFEYRIALSDLDGGRHYLQLISASHGDDAGYSLELHGTPAARIDIATAVPEPGTLTLFAAWLLALGFARGGVRSNR